MSSPKWTPEQQAAIDLKGQILVAAAAGSGKTAVLVQRLINRITDSEAKVDVDRFLVVTFTKAAASEMRERIGKALEDALFSETDPAQVEHLLQQRALLYRASITTLHSFCMELIRQYFYELELDPAFRVADEAEADLLRQDTLEDLFEAHYSQENASFQALVDALGTDRDDQPVMECILRLHEFAMSQAHPREWLNGLSTAYRWTNLDDLLQSPWGQVMLQGIQEKVAEALAALDRAYLLSTQPGGPLQYAPTLQEDMSRLQVLAQTLDRGVWNEIDKAFREAVSFPSLPRGKKGQTDSLLDEEEIKRLREESKGARDEAKKKLEGIKTGIFSVPLAEQLPLLEKMSVLVQTLAQVTLEFTDEYQKAKRLKNIVDFADLEHFALKLLENGNQPSPIAQKLREQYVEVLVDEYQDINPVQELILHWVSRQNEQDANLFMVGDVKQSIYRFRMADPGLFLRKYAEFPHYKAGEETPTPDLVIDLNQNFRSRPEVIQGINYLYYQIMTEGAGEIAYDEQAALRPGAKFLSSPDLKTAEGPIEVHLFDPKAIDLSVSACAESGLGEVTEPTNKPGNQEKGRLSTGGYSIEQDKEPETGEEDPSLEEAETARIEARLVASRIQKMVLGREFQIYDKELGDLRPVQYSDIVILMRSLASNASVYVEEFQRAGIPVYAETNSGYLGTNEIDTMLSLLKIIDNPRLDIPLAAVLRSPLVGMNGTELGRLRSLLPQGDFYETIVLAFRASLNSQKGMREDSTDTEFQEILAKYESHLPQLLAKAKNVLEITPGIKEKLNLFFPKLQAWRQLARRTSLADLLWHLYEDTGYLAYVGTLPSGLQRQANLRILYDRACRYEATNYRGLFRFLRFLEKFQGQGKDLGSASTCGEKENVVRLITVHSSKGLEFPVVFLVGLGRQFNTRSLSSQLLLHSQLGVGIPLIDIENQIRYPSIIQYAVRERLWQEALAEELRILYVALTRAKERLFLYGHLNKLDETINKWCTLAESTSSIAFPDGLLRSAKAYIDWIGPALARHPQDLFNIGRAPSTLDLPDCTSQWKLIIHERITDIPIDSLIGESEVLLNEDKVVEPPVSQKNQQVSDIEVELGEGELESERSKDDENTLEKLKSEVFSRLDWQYPYLDGVNQSAKTSVSELKRQQTWFTDGEYGAAFSLSTPSFLRPKFVQTQKELTPAEKGTVVHTAIQHLPLAQWRTLWDSLSQGDKGVLLQDFIHSLIQRDILTEEQGREVSPLVLVNLLDSKIGKRLLSAEEVRREVPFTLSLALKAQKEPVLVQGIIDAIILSPQRHWSQIIDFKTDYLLDEEDPEKKLIQRYALQFSLYALAVERLLKLPVQDCIIYATSINREFVIPRDIIKPTLGSLM